MSFNHRLLSTRFPAASLRFTSEGKQTSSHSSIICQEAHYSSPDTCIMRSRCTRGAFSDERSIKPSAATARGVKRVDVRPFGLQLQGQQDGQHPAACISSQVSHVPRHRKRLLLVKMKFPQSQPDTEHSILLLLCHVDPEKVSGASTELHTAELKKKRGEKEN